MAVLRKATATSERNAEALTRRPHGRQSINQVVNKSVSHNSESRCTVSGSHGLGESSTRRVLVKQKALTKIESLTLVQYRRLWRYEM